MSVIDVTADNFEQEVLKSDKITLVDFWAAWCGPCKMLSPIVDEVASSHPEIKVCKVNVDEEPSLAQQYNVMSIPMLLVFEHGSIKQKSIGVISKSQIEALVS
ncbi:MAG: thioredoxin [Wujia sp.]